VSIIGVIVIIAIVAAAANSSKTSNPSQTNSLALVTTATSSASGSASQATATPTTAAAAPQVFKGDGSENIGTLSVPTQSTLTWKCPTCANNNVIIDNSPSDAGTITVTADGPTGGRTAIDAGTYHDVSVNTEGQAWTITIAPSP
jgi:cytoskeletal protein RodZ